MSTHTYAHVHIHAYMYALAHNEWIGGGTRDIHIKHTLHALRVQGLKFSLEFKVHGSVLRD